MASDIDLLRRALPYIRAYAAENKLIPRSPCNVMADEIEARLAPSPRGRSMAAPPAVGELQRLARLFAGDANAALETNEVDLEDPTRGGDGITYAGSAEEAAEIRARMEDRPWR